MSHGLERRGDLGAPSFAEIRRVFNGACEIEKHEKRLSAIQGCRSTQIWRGLGRVFQRFSYVLSEIPSGARELYRPAESLGRKICFYRKGPQRSQKKELVSFL